MNYTQKFATCKTIPHNFNKLSHEKKKEESSASSSSGVALLVNKEVDDRVNKYEHIFKKHNRKFIAQYALAYGNLEKNPLEKRRLKKHLFEAEFKLKEKNDSILKKINISLCNCGTKPHFNNIENDVFGSSSINTKNRSSTVDFNEVL